MKTEVLLTELELTLLLAYNFNLYRKKELSKDTLLEILLPLKEIASGDLHFMLDLLIAHIENRIKSFCTLRMFSLNQQPELQSLLGELMGMDKKEIDQLITNTFMLYTKKLATSEEDIIKACENIENNMR
ncbi:MAG: hypothetical protein LBG67_01690 [Campylobacteraceae bacterium]|nr:hypothetical protein [Campylobacteraceae bacterium]